MKKVASLLLISLFIFGGFALSAEEIKVPLEEIKSSCYGKIDMSKAEFALSEVGEECVNQDWLEENLSKKKTENEEPKGEDSEKEVKPKDSPIDTTIMGTVDELQDRQEWIIESGEEVILEDISTETPTDLIIEEGGSLIIRNCDLYMLGQDHADNYIHVHGSLTIENSHLEGEPYIPPYITSSSPNASIEIKSSRLGRDENLGGFHVTLRAGGKIDLEGVDFLDTLEVWGTEGPIEEGGTVSAQSSVIDGLKFRLGGISGDFRLEGLKPSMESFAFNLKKFSVELKNCQMDSISIANVGTESEGELNLHVVDSALLDLYSVGDGNVILEDTSTCNLNLGNKNYHEYYGLPESGFYSDRVIVDQPSRKIRLINSSFGGTSSHCPKNGKFGINLGGRADLKVVNSTLNKLQVSQNLEAKNIYARFFQIYANTGDLHFESSKVENLALVVSANTTISGELSIKNKEIGDWGGLEELSLTRRYPIMLLDKNGERLPNKTVELLNSDGEVVDTATTNSEGKAEVQISFNKSNLENTWTLQAPSQETSTTLKALSNTPVILSSDTNPPSPNPMTWEAPPHASSSTTIKMEATPATDPEGSEVEYYFEERTGNSDGNDSGWQTSATYEDDNLEAGTKYCYMVRARDKSLNKTDWSREECLTTEGE
ncbi:hypothetical protein K9M78_01290 [Candidatus Bipolaricaulota bacterium]|nr:hypothetical protein [Candidatus Bipolaricaulota bacterium]